MPPIELAKLSNPPEAPESAPLIKNNQIDVDLKALREKVKLFIATPMYGGNCHGLYMKSAINLQILMNQLGIECRFSFLFNESLIPRARNYLVDEFLRSGYSHMLFIDSDIEFNPQDVLSLLVFDKDVIGGPYPKKSIKWDNVKLALQKNPNLPASDLEKVVGDYVFNPVPGTQNFNVYQPLDVLEIGTGFMMVKREVFERYAKQYPEFEYTPDHQGQANFDGSRKIHAYFHCDIDPKSNRYLSEDYWFCVPSGCKVLTEDGPMTIGKIVNSKYNGKVKSLDASGKMVWQNVIGWSKRKNNTKKPWVKINTENSNNRFGKLKCTADHRIAVIDDVMSPSVQFVEAQFSEGKYSVRNVQKNENPLYGKSSLSVLIGTLLGDATINKNGQLSLVHSIKQHDYHEYKNKLLNGKEMFAVQPSSDSFSPSSLVEMSVYPVNAQTKHLRKMMYLNGTKTVENIVNYIDDISLAFWFMDDGSICKDCASLATYGFSLEDNLLLIEMFKNKWGMSPVLDKKTAVYKGEHREYYGLRFNLTDSKKLFNVIARHIHPAMQYKIPESFHCEYNQLSPDAPDLLEYSASKVMKVVPVNMYSMLYDIEVNETHNFVADNTVVHNCQLWRNMGGQIFYCPWMLTKHVGTYAFNGDLPAIAAMTGKL